MIKGTDIRKEIKKSDVTFIELFYMKNDLFSGILKNEYQNYYYMERSLLLQINNSYIDILQNIPPIKTCEVNT